MAQTQETRALPGSPGGADEFGVIGRNSTGSSTATRIPYAGTSGPVIILCPSDCSEQAGMGECDTNTGTCVCADGFEGRDCNDASCCPTWFYVIAVFFGLLVFCCCLYKLRSNFLAWRYAENEDEDAETTVPKSEGSHQDKLNRWLFGGPGSHISTFKAQDMPADPSAFAGSIGGVGDSSPRTDSKASPRTGSKSTPVGRPRLDEETDGAYVRASRSHPLGGPDLRSAAQAAADATNRASVSAPAPHEQRARAAESQSAFEARSRPSAAQFPTSGRRVSASEAWREKEPDNRGNKSPPPHPGRNTQQSRPRARSPQPTQQNPTPKLDEVVVVESRMRHLMDKPLLERKKLFRELVLEHHPDKSSHQHATEIFQAVNGARSWFLEEK